jgi:hypothetical protein
MSENAYIQGSKVLLISEADNTVYDNTDKKGENVDISSASKFSDKTGMSKNDSTEFFVNFDHSTKNEANRRIELRVTFKSADAEAAFDKYASVNISEVAIENGYTVYVNNLKLEAGSLLDYADHAKYSYADGAKITYEKVFRADDLVKDNDLKVIKGIFGMADDDEGTTWGVQGSVFVGTNSKDVTDLYTGYYYEGDKSNTMSFSAFKDEYIDTELENNWDTANNGEWVKVIDNNGDGVADYAFKTTFTLDKAVDTYTKNDESTLRYYALDLINGDVTGRYMNTVAEGDVVLHTTIDDQAIIWKADSVEDTITNINDIYKRSITATTSSGDVYSQSEIDNATRMDQLISQMSENVTYRMYLDAFGRIRAYEDDGVYALITEMYYGNYRNNRYVLNDVLTAEMKAGNESITERVVNNPVNNDFLLNVSNLGVNNLGNDRRNNWADLNAKMNELLNAGLVPGYQRDLYQNVVTRANWDDVVHNWTGTDWAKNVVLQPATAHLGFNTQSTLAEGIFLNATTNVARYVVNADGTVTLSTAVRSYNNDNKLTTDYVRLTETSVKKGQNVFAADVADGFNRFVDAVNDTQFYIVSNSGVEHFVGYSNLPAVSDIRSMYAVARTDFTDYNRDNYWVAEVIVIEADGYAAQPDDYLLVLGRADYNSTVLSNSRQAVGTQNVLAISAKQGGEIRITPTSYNWGTNTVNPGIYKAYGVAELESGLYSVATLKPVTAKNVNNALDSQSVNTSAFKLRAGDVHKLWGMNSTIEVDLRDGSTPIRIDLKGAAMSVTQKSNRISIGHRMNGDWDSNLVKDESKIFWVEDGSGNVLFAIDVTYSLDNSDKGSTIYNLLNGIYEDVIYSQNHKTLAGDHKLNITYTDSTHGDVEKVTKLVNSGTEFRVDAAPAGYTLATPNNGCVFLAGTTTSAIGKGCYVVTPDTNNTTFAIRDITADLDVTVNVTAENFTVTANKIEGATVQITKKCPDDTNFVTATLNQLHAGDTVRVAVTRNGSTDGTYSLKAVTTKGTELNVTKVDANSNTYETYEFKMPADGVTLTGGYEVTSYPVIWAGDTQGVKYQTSGKNIPGNTFTFKAEAKDGYELESVVASKGSIVRDLLNGNGDDTYTIAGDVTGKGLTVTFKTKLVNGDVTIKAGGNVAPRISTPFGEVTGINEVWAGNLTCEKSFNIIVYSSVDKFLSNATGCVVETIESNDAQTTLRVTVYAEGAELTISQKS